ncbi:uncharacterized protein OCT59_017917 [Rhizophagus irregularis]|uniref:Uncharacterized protein n=1 Tax=Rhizophagus irregularis TaxID=588596 RepID=A0A916DY79_9GLOM|nr:hypothetical protein OCT59_017917 [Rhizophagus irregularis]CAB4475879.1 unnamed protein product [Rhizophagus irregularis]CAB5290225.1 unnamed protein product [Rhizophagus irregularis]
MINTHRMNFLLINSIFSKVFKSEKSRNSISVIIAEGISVPDNNNNNNSYIVKHNDILVSHFMSIVFKRKSDKLNSLNSDSLELWEAIHIIVQVPVEAVNLNDVNSIYNWILELNSSMGVCNRDLSL